MKAFNLKERITGVLVGCALGDAMGMPTEMLDREEIKKRFPGGIQTFESSIQQGGLGRTMQAGQVTDDTLNTMFVAQMLIDNAGVVDARSYIDRLSTWMSENGESVAKMFGPSTTRAINSIRNGVPLEQAGMFGTTNGAAMRISPIGIVYDYRNAEELIDAVEQICIPTHNTSPAISCASAVAAAVSYVVRDGDDIGELWDVALDAARRGEQRGNAIPSASVFVRMKSVRGLVEHEDEQMVVKKLQTFYGCGLESVETAPAAFAIISLAEGYPLEAARIAANIGGDTDTLGAIAAAICGGMHPDISGELTDTLEDVNELDFDTTAEELAPLVHMAA